MADMQSLLIPASFLVLLTASAGELEVVVRSRATIIEQAGITGGGTPVKSVDRVVSFFADHPDDFGATKGIGSAISTDGGQTWKKGLKNWPMKGMVSLWADRRKSGDLLAFGIHWLPDPAKRRDPENQIAPRNAYQIGVSNDGGRTWNLARSTIRCPEEIGYIARPLPHIIEDDKGMLFMPAYTWSRRGNKVVLLQSEDGGKAWEVRSVITTAIAMLKSGAKVTTPWLESSVSQTRDGDMLAIVRTGSTVRSALVSVRSSDGGKTWSQATVLPFAGKLPTLHLLDNGVLTLTTALSGNHCRVYLSVDGTGRKWSNAFVISSMTGGNVGSIISGKNNLLLTSSSNRRIDAWHLVITPKPKETSDLAPPSNPKLVDGILSWTPSPNAVAYRITPILIKSGKSSQDTRIEPYSPILSPAAKLDLRRQLLPDGIYAFKISSANSSGQISRPIRSEDFQR